MKKQKYSALLTAMDGILSIAVLALAGYYIDYFYKMAEANQTPGKWWVVSLMFVGMALCQLVYLAMARGGHKLDILRCLVYAVVFLVCAAMIMLSEQNVAVGAFNLDAYLSDGWLKAVVLLYEGALIFSRVLSFLRDRTRRSLLTNIALILVIVAVLWEAEMTTLLLFIVAQVVGHIATLAFARIDMTTLQKIIRKTYAVEILFGIVLLIVAFSVLLPHLEEGIATFGDALWYCFAIVTTIGFGDFSAVTFTGRVLSVVLGLYGIVVVALITSIIVNFYGEMKSNDDED